MAPRGPSFEKKMLSGVVTRCMKYENGITAMKASEITAWKSHTPRWIARSAPSPMPTPSIACPSA